MKLFQRFLLSTLCCVLFAQTLFAARGPQQHANIFQQHRRTQFFMITQPDVDTECRQRIFQCLADYCGDVLVTPGVTPPNFLCHGASENDLFNWVLMCLRRDNRPLLPQFGANTAARQNGMNTAARLCPPYIQSELMAYLSMANMAQHLTLRRSDECVHRRIEVSAALACHQTALAFGNQTQNRLTTELNNNCGPGIPGGSTEMVQRFANAGNIGANVLGWAERIVSLNASAKAPGWELEMDNVLAFYINRMNLACGDNMQVQTPPRPAQPANQLPVLTTIATLAVVNHALNQQDGPVGMSATPAPVGVGTIWAEVRSLSDVFDQNTATQVIHAGLTHSPLTQNPFLTSTQMATMQSDFTRGVRVFILRDSARCFIVPVGHLTMDEQNMIARQFGNCVR